MKDEFLQSSQAVYITGHKNPDTDSVCSAIAYAELKKSLGVNAVAARIGKINRETKFVLDYFGFSEPDYLSSVKTQVSDLSMDIIKPMRPDVSIKEAWTTLKKNGFEVLPVEDDEHKLKGIVSVSDIANANMNMPEGNMLTACSTPIDNIAVTLDAKIIYNTKETLCGSGKVLVAAMSTDDIDSFIKPGDIVLAGNDESKQLKAIDEGTICVIVTCASEFSNKVIKAAKERDCTLITTHYDTFTTARLIYQSIPVSFSMTSEKLVYFTIDDFLDNAKEKMLRTRFRSYPVVDQQGHFKGFISRYHLLNQHKKKVILVDHSEMTQSVNGIEQAEILEIIDHHRIGGIQTGQPIYYRNEPTGSTATIVANLFSEQGKKPSPQIAGILCAAILSDTIQFKSPTSTHSDVITAERLARLANIDIELFSKQMFEAGCALKNMTTEEMIKSDFKDFNISGYKVGIGQINTTDFRSIKKLSTSILGCLSELAENEKYNILMIIFTDIIDEATEVIFVESQKGLVAKAFSPLQDENSFTMHGVVSRKKQIVPKLVEALSLQNT